MFNSERHECLYNKYCSCNSQTYSSTPFLQEEEKTAWPQYFLVHRSELQSDNIIYYKHVHDDKINKPEISLPLMVHESAIIPMKNFTYTHIKNGCS